MRTCGSLEISSLWSQDHVLGENCIPIKPEKVSCWLLTNKSYHYTGWWFGTSFMFPYIGNVIIPTDELIFFRGVGIPPTSISLEYCYRYNMYHCYNEPLLQLYHLYTIMLFLPWEHVRTYNYSFQRHGPKKDVTKLWCF
jgi:hypothetical protein